MAALKVVRMQDEESARIFCLGGLPTGATPGRGGYRREEQALRIADETRSALAEFFHAPDPQGVVCTLNATHAINLALKGFLEPGNYVISSGIEHNTVWRPLKALERRGVQVTTVSCAPDGALDPAKVEAAIRPNTRLAARRLS